MTDRELLELAALAAGIEVEPLGERAMWPGGLWKLAGGWWNPLADDGDALRLAVKLRIKLGYDDNLPPELCLPRSGAYALHGTKWFVEAGIDEYAATRLAIVRVAAEIGKQMKASQ